MGKEKKKKMGRGSVVLAPCPLKVLWAGSPGQARG